MSTLNKIPINKIYIEKEEKARQIFSKTKDRSVRWRNHSLQMKRTCSERSESIKQIKMVDISLIC